VVLDMLVVVVFETVVMVHTFWELNQVQIGALLQALACNGVQVSGAAAIAVVLSIGQQIDCRFLFLKRLPFVLKYSFLCLFQ
jgi:hypothetical protein